MSTSPKLRSRRAAIAASAPDGLHYEPDFLSPEEERTLIDEIEAFSFREVRMRGQVARRTVIHFGWDYDYEGWKIEAATQPPPLLRALADRAAVVAGVEPHTLEQFLVARYPPGATIGWHRDAPMFGTPVVGVSLGGACTMRFRRTVERSATNYETYSQLLEPRSLYVLSGAARTQWQHSISPTRTLRYSITMRTLRRKAVAS